MAANDDLPLTLPALIRRQAQLFGDKLFVASEDARLSYADAEDRSRRLARALLAAGVTKGAHVGVLHPWGPEFVVNVLAIARIGAVVLPFSTLSTADELRGLLANSDTAFLLAAPAYRSHRYDEKLAAAFPELDFSKPPPATSPRAPWLRRIWFSGPVGDGRDPAWSTVSLEATSETVDETYLEAVEARVAPSDRLVIVHTSGSTSAPKGVIHQHGTLIRHSRNINLVRGFGPDRIMYSTSPWFWVAGFAYSMLATYIAGASIVTPHATEPAKILDLLERERPNITSGYWQAVTYLAEDPSFAGRDLSSIRHGNLFPIMARDVQPPDPNLRYSQYGMTEVGGALVLSPDESDLPEEKRGGFGQVLPEFETKIVDPESGEIRGPGESGELWVRSQIMMEGYYGKTRSEVFEPDGWWRTSDIGMFDADGCYFLLGRLGDMIKTSGANVAPREVEAVLTEAAGGRHAIVLGLPDPVRGQMVTAAVIGGDGLDEVALREELGRRLSTYKTPRRIFHLAQEELPLLSSGKPDMRRLAALLQARI